MAKIMLVEDDNNLREIYEARLLAEGYEIVSAHDGEEALAMAVKEKPDLIISDVMMPKISGFDMLDILRSTPEIKDTKVIMMTALGQAEDKDRADKLGADRYLVKSQVTLEDVAKIAREVLDGSGATTPPPIPAAPAAAAPAPAAVPATAIPVVNAPVVAPPADPAPAAPFTPATAPAAAPAEPVIPVPAPAPDPSAPSASTLDSVENAQTASDEKAKLDGQVKDFVGGQSNETDGDGAKPANAADDQNVTIVGKKVLQPINDLTAQPDLDKLLADEQRRDQTASNVIAPEKPDAPGPDPNLIAL